MKTRDIKALHTKDMTELRSMLRETQGALINARLEFGQQKLPNTTSLANFRRDIARIQTVLQAKSLQGVVAESKPVEKTEKKSAEAKADKGGKK